MRRSPLDDLFRSHSSAFVDRCFVYTATTVFTLWPLALGLMLSAAWHSDPGASSPVVRAMAPFVRALITDTAARSATVRELLARLACTDVIVYVELTGSMQVPVARTKLVTSAPGVRFLRIGINAALPSHDLAPLLAHELQHAVEIAENPSVTTEDGVRRLYERIGRALGDDRFETEAARDVEWIVRGELRRKIGG